MNDCVFTGLVGKIVEWSLAVVAVGTAALVIAVAVTIGSDIVREWRNK